MLIGEYEGSGHLCPMKLHSFLDDGEERVPDNRDCETTNCMAWRWYDKSDSGSERRGYCGMAGKPRHDGD